MTWGQDDPGLLGHIQKAGLKSPITPAPILAEGLLPLYKETCMSGMGALFSWDSMGTPVVSGQDKPEGMEGLTGAFLSRSTWCHSCRTALGSALRGEFFHRGLSGSWSWNLRPGKAETLSLDLYVNDCVLMKG